MSKCGVGPSWHDTDGLTRSQPAHLEARESERNRRQTQWQEMSHPTWGRGLCWDSRNDVTFLELDFEYHPIQCFENPFWTWSTAIQDFCLYNRLGLVLLPSRKHMITCIRTGKKPMTYLLLCIIQEEMLSLLLQYIPELGVRHVFCFKSRKANKTVWSFVRWLLIFLDYSSEIL